MLDRGEVPLLVSNEGLVRALLYWGRAAAQGYSAAQVRTCLVFHSTVFLRPILVLFEGEVG